MRRSAYLVLVATTSLVLIGWMVTSYFRTFRQPLPGDFSLADQHLVVAIDQKIRIELPRALSPDSVRNHIVTPWPIISITPEVVVLDPTGSPLSDGDVVIQAGAIDLEGATLAEDWKTSVRRDRSSQNTQGQTETGLGPVSEVMTLEWADSDRAFTVLRMGESYTAGILSANSEQMRTLLTNKGALFMNAELVLGDAVLYSDQTGTWLKQVDQQPRRIGADWPWEISPTKRHIVAYDGDGTASLVDLSTGMIHSIPAPKFAGSHQYNSWSPDGALYLLQGPRERQVPSLYFADTTGKIALTFDDPGRYSVWATWAPDSQRVAFLSVGETEHYSHPPDAWDEPPLAPRMGVLDLRTKQVKYAELQEATFFGTGLWSPDGRTIAVTAGSYPAESGRMWLSDSAVYTTDSQTLRLKKIAQASSSDYLISPVAWSPDSRHVLLQQSHRDDTGLNRFTIVTVGGQELCELTADSVMWISSTHLLAVSIGEAGERVAVVDMTGSKVRDLALSAGQPRLAVSPDGRHVAVFLRTSPKGAEGYIKIVSIPSQP